MIEMFNKEELAAYLNVPLKTIRYLLYQKRLPKVKIGKEYQFIKDDIDRWILSQREQPKYKKVRKW